MRLSDVGTWGRLAYIHIVPKYLVTRIIAGLIGLATGLAAPVTAVAHGFVHAHALYFEAHGADVGGVLAHDHHGTEHNAGPALSHAGGPDHAHPSFDSGPRPRLDVLPFLAVLVVLAAPLQFPVTRSAPSWPTGYDPGTHPPSSPPPRLRAPPFA